MTATTLSNLDAWPVTPTRISRYNAERLRGFLGAAAMLVSEPDTHAGAAV